MRHRHHEFADYVRTQAAATKPKMVRFGSLLFHGTSVHSYNMHIAEVDTQNMAVLWNAAAIGRSPTTSAHLRAVTNAQYLMPDWTFLGVPDNKLSHSVLDCAQALWGPKVSAKNLKATFHFYHTVGKYNKHNGVLQDANVRVKEYVAANKHTKDAMLAIFELGAG